MSKQMNPAAASIYSTVSATHEQVHQQLKTVEQAIKVKPEMERLADIIYALKEAHKLIDAIRKDLRETEELAEKICCALWVQHCTATNDFKGEPIRTEYVTASPDVKVMASLPRKGTPEFVALMTHMGVPIELVSGDENFESPLSPNFNGMIDYLSSLVAAGKPLPPGIEANRTYNRYRVSCRGKKGPNETV